MGDSGGCVPSCLSCILLCVRLADEDTHQRTQFHGWLGINFEQCKWQDCLKSCFLLFLHFSDRDTHGLQRLTEVCNGPP
jgi:hypothetical protein